MEHDGNVMSLLYIPCSYHCSQFKCTIGKYWYSSLLTEQANSCLVMALPSGTLKNAVNWVGVSAIISWFIITCYRSSHGQQRLLHRIRNIL